MKTILTLILCLGACTGFAQGHNTLDGTGMKEIAFLEGDWSGKQNFNVPSGTPLIAEVVDHVSEAVGGRYLEERLATTMPGRQPTDVRHFITYDPVAKLYKAWWFNDTSRGPMEFEGMLTNRKLVMQTKSGSGPNVFRATYDASTEGALNYTFELQSPTGWRLLFSSSYTKFVQKL